MLQGQSEKGCEEKKQWGRKRDNIKREVEPCRSERMAMVWMVRVFQWSMPSRRERLNNSRYIYTSSERTHTRLETRELSFIRVSVFFSLSLLLDSRWKCETLEWSERMVTKRGGQPENCTCSRSLSYSFTSFTHCGLVTAYGVYRKPPQTKTHTEGQGGKRGTIESLSLSLLLSVPFLSLSPFSGRLRSRYSISGRNFVLCFVPWCLCIYIYAVRKAQENRDRWLWEQSHRSTLQSPSLSLLRQLLKFRITCCLGFCERDAPHREGSRG